MPSARNPDAAGKAIKRRQPRISASLRALAKAKATATALPNMTEAPLPKGNNPSARRTRQLARKGWLIGWPFSQS